MALPRERDCAIKGAGTGPRGSGDKAGGVGKDARRDPLCCM